MKQEKQPMPNIVVWSWMREVLQLSGLDLLLFAFLFERTFDGVHKCFDRLTDFEHLLICDELQRQLAIEVYLNGTKR